MGILGPRVPSWGQVRVVTLAPGDELAYDSADWCDAIVLVDQGKVILEGLHGSHTWFACGDILWLQDLPLRAILNQEDVPAVLIAVSRRPQDSR